MDDVQRSPITAGIRGRLDTLNPAEAKVASVIVELGGQLVYRSASEVAELSGAALSTVVRTCQALGCRGFQDLKISLAREHRPPTPAERSGSACPRGAACSGAVPGGGHLGPPRAGAGDRPPGPRRSPHPAAQQGQLSDAMWVALAVQRRAR